MSEEVVVDANIAVKWATPEPLAEKAQAILEFWARGRVILLAPSFFLAEVDSSLRRKVILRRELSLEDAETAWRTLGNMPVTLLDPMTFRRRAWEISILLGHAHVYDSVYLALAEAKECEFWTADERLFNATKDRFPFVKWLGDFNP